MAPLWILRDVRVSPGLRIRLIAIFSCSVMTTMAGIAHAVLVLRMPGALEAIMGESLPPTPDAKMCHHQKSPRMATMTIGEARASPISHVTDAFHDLDPSLSNSDVRFF